VSSHAHQPASVIAIRPAAPTARPAPAPAAREPLWRHVVGDVLRRERLAQERTLKEVAEAALISMPYLSEIERGRKEASSEVLAAAAHALGLGLADLLTLAQGELARLARATAARAATRQPYLRSADRAGAGPIGRAAASPAHAPVRPAGPQMFSRQAEMSLAA
jgi:transcriptional regulator with XRE-family HTH domain